VWTICCCREKKCEFVGLAAQSEDRLCFTSHAGFDVVSDIAERGLHVGLLDSYNDGPYLFHRCKKSFFNVFYFLLIKMRFCNVFFIFATFCDKKR